MFVLTEIWNSLKEDSGGHTIVKSKWYVDCPWQRIIYGTSPLILGV